MKTIERFEPRILGFLCNWCAYAGADLAGVSRFQYPANIRIIRVMCSARVDPAIVLEAFIHKLDGVMVLGCHPGDCHYMTGNYYAEKRIKMTKKILETVRISPERLLINWVSAGEGERFTTLVKSFTEEMRKLGPLGNEIGLGTRELKARLVAAREAVSQLRLRWLVGKERELVEETNVYGEKLSQEEFSLFMLEAIKKEYLKNRILQSIKDDGLTVKEIARRVEATPSEVLRRLIVMERDRLVSVAGIKENSPKYRKAEGQMAA